MTPCRASSFEALPSDLARFVCLLPPSLQAFVVSASLGQARRLRPRTPDSEKITVNLGFVDLGHVDLMVQEGYVWQSC